MDNILTPVTTSLKSDRGASDVRPCLVDHDRQPAAHELDHTNLADILRNDLVPTSTRLVAPSMSSTLSEFAIDRSVLSTNITTPYSLPSIMSLSSITASSLDNNNVSINCSFTNSSVDSRDDDAYGLHVTFDDDNRPQLRPKDASQTSAGFELMKVACTLEKSATMDIPGPALCQIQDSPVPSSLPETVSETTNNAASVPQIVPEVTCVASSSLSNPVQAICPPTTLPCMTSEELPVHNAASSPSVAETAPSVSTVANVLPQNEADSINPLGDGGTIEGEEKRGSESASGRDETAAQEVLTSLDDGLVSNEKNTVTCGVPEPNSSVNQAVQPLNQTNQTAKSSPASNKIDQPSKSQAPVEKSDGNSNPTDPRGSKSSPASAPVTPIRKSVRTHRNPLNTDEFVSLDISPRSRAKTAANKRLSLDNGSAAMNAHRTKTGTRGVRSLPAGQPQSSKPRKEPARSRKCGSTSVQGVCFTGAKQKCMMPEQAPLKPDPKTTNSPGLPAEPAEIKRKRGRPRKNPAAVNGKTGVHYEGVQLAAGGSWSSLNSKAAGDSSLGSIGLVSELFSVTPFTPVPSNSSMPAANDPPVNKENSTPANKSYDQPPTTKSQSPIADVSFARLDELSSLDQKHKKKKKKKKKKKSRHSSLDLSEGDSKVVGNLDDLIAALQNVRMSASDGVSQPSQQSESSLSDGCRMLAKIFSRSFCSQTAAALQRSFVVRSKTSGCTGSSLPAVGGNRSRTGRKTSPLVGGMAHSETRQSCLPPKKRHRLQMAHNISHSMDTSRSQGIGRSRRGRPSKFRTNHLGQKPVVKTSKFCSKFCSFVCVV